MHRWLRDGTVSRSANGQHYTADWTAPVGHTQGQYVLNGLWEGVQRVVRGCIVG
jgi:hypothetical protein